MDSQQKKFFLISGIAVMAIIVIAYFFYNNGDSSEEFAIPENKKTSEYDKKLDSYRRNQGTTSIYSQQSQIFTSADSIMEDGNVKENPLKVEERESSQQISKQREDLNRRLTKAVSSASSNISNKQPDEEPIKYYKAMGNRILYDKDGNGHFENLPANLPQPSYNKNQRSSSEPAKENLSQKELRRRAIENSYNKSDYSEYIIPCVIHTTQDVSNGKMVKVRVTKNVDLGGHLIARNTILFAKVTFDRNRAILIIDGLKIGNDYIAQSLTGLGEDGQPGLPVSMDEVASQTTDAVTNEVVNQAANAATQIAGKLGSTVSSIARSITSVKRQQNKNTVSFIDKQKINFIQSDLLQ